MIAAVALDFLDSQKTRANVNVGELASQFLRNSVRSQAAGAGLSPRASDSKIEIFARIGSANEGHFPP